MNIYLQAAGAAIFTVGSFCGLEIPTADASSPLHARVLIQAERALTHGKPERAIALLSTKVDSLRLHEQRARGYALLCKAHFQKEAFTEAERACDAAVQEEEEDAHWSHLNNRGVMRLLLGRLDEAEADFESALREKPKAKGVHTNKAILEKQQAVVDLESAIALK